MTCVSHSPAWHSHKLPGIQISVRRLGLTYTLVLGSLPKCLEFKTVHTGNLFHCESCVFWPIWPHVSREWDSPVQFSGIWQNPSPTLQCWGQGGWNLMSLKPHSLPSERFQTIFGGFQLAASLCGKTGRGWSGFVHFLKSLISKSINFSTLAKKSLAKPLETNWGAEQS